MGRQVAIAIATETAIVTVVATATESAEAGPLEQKSRWVKATT